MLEPLDHSDTESIVNAISDLYVCISTINSSNSILGQKTHRYRCHAQMYLVLFLPDIACSILLLQKYYLTDALHIQVKSEIVMAESDCVGWKSLR